jgi:hypothetical protein
MVMIGMVFFKFILVFLRFGVFDLFTGRDRARRVAMDGRSESQAVERRND